MIVNQKKKINDNGMGLITFFKNCVVVEKRLNHTSLDVDD